MRHHRASRAILALLAASALAACTGSSSSPAAVGSSGPGLDLASTGLCHALTQLPDDVPGSVRAFQNEAHDTLHTLAAMDRLDRGMAARVLEAMQRVESDITGGPQPQPLEDDLRELLSATDTALKALGRTPPPCSVE